ncbi:roadblock/LC7 domain-containing protein [Streptomyces sp. NPDC001817]|uniref:roadblock/LC7 domain-containing protein n=1 Tax=Streptomyces sp. NPDC001817 TaxID=3154398 RepID=UPI00332877FE
MVSEEDLQAVLAELHRLRNRVPQLTGALAAGVDGLVVAHDTPGVDPEGLAALTAAALGVAVRVADATGNGGFRELLVRGEHGHVATYAAGRTAVLTLLAEDRVNVGRLHLEGRRSGARIGELLDAADTAARQARRSGRAERTQDAVDSAPPTRTRTTRTPRATGATSADTRTARNTPAATDS